MALLSAAAAGLAIAACCAFWIGTAWSNGATAALMAAIFSCFFASQDNPVPGIMQFLTYTVYSIPLSALYLLGIMPAIHSFEMLALAMLPTAFVIGVFIARPASAGRPWRCCSASWAPWRCTTPTPPTWSRSSTPRSRRSWAWAWRR